VELVRVRRQPGFPARLNRTFRADPHPDIGPADAEMDDAEVPVMLHHADLGGNGQALGRPVLSQRDVVRADAHPDLAMLDPVLHGLPHRPGEG